MGLFDDPSRFQKVFGELNPKVQQELLNQVKDLDRMKAAIIEVGKQAEISSAKLSKLGVAKEALDAVTQVYRQQKSYYDDIEKQLANHGKRMIAMNKMEQSLNEKIESIEIEKGKKEAAHALAMRNIDIERDKIKDGKGSEEELKKYQEELTIIGNALNKEKDRLSIQNQFLAELQREKDTEIAIQTERLKELPSLEQEMKLAEGLVATNKLNVASEEVGNKVKEHGFGLLKKGLAMIGIETAAIESAIIAIGSLFGVTLTAAELLAPEIMIPLSILAGIITGLGLAIDRVFSLSDAAKNFRIETGLIDENAKSITDEFRSISRNLATTMTPTGFLGVTIENVEKNAASLTNRFGIMSSLISQNNGELLSYATTFSKVFRVPEEDTAAVLQNLTAVSGGSTDIAAKWTHMIGFLGSIKGLMLPVNKIVHDIAEASGETLLALSGQPKEIILAAAYARAYGTTLEGLNKRADNILDFQKSVNDEMQLSVLLGRNINYQSARQDFWQGNLVAGLEEQNKIIDNISDGEFKNRLVMKSTADLFGESTDELQKQVMMRRYLNEHPDQLEHLKSLGVQVDYQSESIDQMGNDYVKSLEKADAQRLENDAKEQLQSAANAAITSIADTLLPEAQLTLNAILKTLDTMSGYVVSIMNTITSFTDFMTGKTTASTILNTATDVSDTISAGAYNPLGWIDKKFQESLDADQVNFPTEMPAIPAPLEMPNTFGRRLDKDFNLNPDVNNPSQFKYNPTPLAPPSISDNIINAIAPLTPLPIGLPPLTADITTDTDTTSTKTNNNDKSPVKIEGNKELLDVLSSLTMVLSGGIAATISSDAVINTVKKDTQRKS